MAFTGTISANTNLIINTSSLNVYLFKEPNINLSIEKKTKKIKNDKGELFEISQDIFETGFANKQLNNFFGVEKVKTENSLDFLDGESEKMTTVTQVQIYPTAVSSSLIDTRRRKDFIFEAWRDDEFSQSNIDTLLTNLNNSRQASNIPGYTTPSLYGFNLTGSIWPLDYYMHPTNYLTGGRVVCGELNLFVDPLTYQIVGTSNFISASIRSFLPVVSFGGSVNSSSNVPWTAPFLANSKPFQDSELKFSSIISKKYINYSIIPEYNLSSKITDENFENIETIAYDESFNFYCTGSSYITSFTEPKIITGTIKFDIKSVLQLRPYKNFYPVQFTLECAKSLSSSLSKIDVYNQNIQYAQALSTSFNSINLYMSPFFAPGILYNSIKAGMPVPCMFDSNQFFNLADFETIFDPHAYMFGKGYYNTPAFTASLNTNIYKNKIKNFLEEIKKTFCKNNSLKYFSSSNESDFKIFNSGTNYVLDLEILLGNLNYNLNNLIVGGANFLGMEAFWTFNDDSGFNTPPWFPNIASDDLTYLGNSCARISFTPTLTRKYELDEIFALSSVNFYPNKLTSSFTNHKLTLSSSFNLFEKETDLNGNSKWKINSKWEFPFLVATATFMTFSGNTKREQNSVNGYRGGIWIDFCEIPSENQGLFLKLSDLKISSSAEFINSASLADMVGFPINQLKRVGELNSFKNIKELLCIVPYKVSDNSLFDISPSSTLAQQNYRNFAKYIVPPKLDHHKDGVTSKIAFCVEITDQWSKRDLSYVWQNLLPQNGLNHKEFNTIYTVDAESQNLLQNQNVKFMIFKCKERSSVNPSGTWNGYNWPYDFFSLQELCKIDIIQEV